MATKKYYKKPIKELRNHNNVKLYRPELFKDVIYLAGPAPFADHLRYRIKQQYGHGNAPILAERLEHFYDGLFKGLEEVDNSIPGLNAEWPYSFTPQMSGTFTHNDCTMNFRFGIGQRDTNAYNCARRFGLSRGEGALIWPSMADVMYGEKLTGPMWEWANTFLRYVLWAMELEHYVEQTLVKMKLVLPSWFHSEEGAFPYKEAQYIKRQFLASANPVYGPVNKIKPLEIPFDVWQRKVNHQNNLQICKLMDMIAMVTMKRGEVDRMGIEIFHCDATKATKYVDADE